MTEEERMVEEGGVGEEGGEGGSVTHVGNRGTLPESVPGYMRDLGVQVEVRGGRRGAICVGNRATFRLSAELFPGCDSRDSACCVGSLGT